MYGYNVHAWTRPREQKSPARNLLNNDNDNDNLKLAGLPHAGKLP
jgi:hypothetical protein